MTNSSPDVLIAGASARAATYSAVRGGLVVAAADLFADRDLSAVADATIIKHWPDEIEPWAARFPSSVPFLYTGGLENHPELLERIAKSRPVCAIVGRNLRLCRHPETLFEILSAHRVAVAPLRELGEAGVGRWLVKPRRGAGGRGIRRFQAGSEIHAEQYVQKFIPGTAGSAAFLAMSDGSVELIGMCESIGGLNFDSNPFAYYGSIVRRDWTSEMLEQAGSVLAAKGLRGLFGVDFIRQNDGTYVIIEVNPRFTASMELYELSTGRSLVAEHLTASGVSAPKPSRVVCTKHPDAVFGKRIVYAPQDLTCELGQPATHADICSGAYVLADLPQSELTVEAVTPICTVIAAADDVAACRLELEKRENAVLASSRISCIK